MSRWFLFIRFLILGDVLLSHAVLEFCMYRIACVCAGLNSPFVGMAKNLRQRRIHSAHAFVSVCVCVSTLASVKFRRRICPNVLMPASRSAVASGSSTSIERRPGISRVESPRFPPFPPLSPSRQVKDQDVLTFASTNDDD